MVELMLLALAGACLLVLASHASSQAIGPGPVEHRPPAKGWIPVDSPGACDQPGGRYVLTRDVVSPASALFLGNDVTLDLNGYTVSYAAGGYQHVPNYGFEQGLDDWDTSAAPSARTEETGKVKPFIGARICRLSAGEEIVSKYVTLPVADRSYYAMCGVLTWDMEVTVSVEDAAGRPVVVQSGYGGRARCTCPVTGKPRLGGGFVFAHLHHLPAGKYRIRVKAHSDCLIDEVDIRPAMDVGIGIVGKVFPDASYERIYEGTEPAAFTDYLKEGTTDQPVDAVPRAAGKGTVTIRNGTIRSGFEGVRSWAVQCTAKDVCLVLENVKIVAGGINTHAVSAHKARISNCRFEIDTPFIIQRHRLLDSPVALVDADGSQVAACEFIGGQGCLHVKGKDIRIHDNLFVNRQTVTNHYSLMLGGCRNVSIFRNRFEPEIGSGITLYRSKDNEVYENTFRIVAANGNCEYTNEDYTTNAIRITDYNSKQPDRASSGNKIHHNKMHLTGRFYTNYEGNIPVVTGLFCSVGGGANYVYENDIVVDHQAPDTPAQACAFYIGGSSTGGEYRGNRVTTNVPAFWIANPYGHASNVKVIDNTIVKADGAPEDFQPFRFGWGDKVATDVQFAGNRFVGCEFGIQATDVEHSYTRTQPTA